MKRLAPLVAFAALAFGTAVRANDVDPFDLEKEHFVSSKTRADVVADLQAAQAAGQLPVAGEIGVRFADAPSTKPRAQIVAETLEAQRLGLLRYGEVGPRLAMHDEQRQIEMAGIRALERLAAARRNAGQAGS
jgi:Domain of unknown function (DUF4148)